MVLVGKVNKDIVLLINRHGQPAVGLCGDDGLLFRAARKVAPSGQDIGFVGGIERVDVDVLTHVAQDYIPVVASVGADREGNSYNINADEAAGAVARALGAYKLMFLTDVPGWLRDPADPGERRLRGRRRRGARRRSPSVAGGMRPKLQACVDAIHGGVSFAHIVDGRVPHSLLLELFTDAGQGTKIGPRGMSLAELQELERAHAMPTYVRNPVEFVRGAGLPAVGRRRQRVPRLPGRDLGPERRPLPPAGGRGGARAGRTAHPRHQPVLHRAGDAAVGAAVRELARRQGVPVQLGRRGQRGGDQARAPRAAAAATWSCSRARSTAAPTARCRPRRRSPSRRRSRRSCPGSWSCRRIRARWRPRSTSTPRRCCSSRSRARPGSTSCPTSCCSPPARRATAPAPRWCSTRSRPGWGGPGRCGPTSRPTSSPTR